MIILPNQIERWKALVPQRRLDWMGPTIGDQRTASYADKQPIMTWWRVHARLDDGHCVWRGVTRDREDFDAFVDALIRYQFFGTPIPPPVIRLIKGQPYDWSKDIRCSRYDFDQYWQLHALDAEKYGTPERWWTVPWDWNNGITDPLPGYVPQVPYDLPSFYWPDDVPWLMAPGTYLNVPSSSPWTVASNWNTNNNKIETIGPGGSGGVAISGTTDGFNPGPTQRMGTGGGAGGYSSQPNNPLTRGGSQPFAVGDGGASSSSFINNPATGVPGSAGTSDTVFGATTIPSPSSIVGAAKGSGGPTAVVASPAPFTLPGGAGGVAASGKGAVKTSGGAGGNTLSQSSPALFFGRSGSGGAGGPNGDGACPQSAVPAPNSPTQTGTYPGGNADASGTGAGTGSTGSTPLALLDSTNPGGGGTEMDASHGSGGGSGAAGSPGAPPAPISTVASGAGGQYGGGSGSAFHVALGFNVPVSSGKGGAGLIAITNTLGGLWLPPSMTGIGDGGPFFSNPLNARRGASMPLRLVGPGGAAKSDAPPGEPVGVSAKGKSFTGWPSCLR